MSVFQTIGRLLGREAEEAAWKDWDETQRSRHLRAHPFSQFRTGKYESHPVDFGQHMERKGWERQGAGVWAHPESGRTLTRLRGTQAKHRIKITHANGDETVHHTDSDQSVARMMTRYARKRVHPTKPRAPAAPRGAVMRVKPVTALKKRASRTRLKTYAKPVR